MKYLMKPLCFLVLAYVSCHTTFAEIAIQETIRTAGSQVNPNIDRKPIPPTPNNMPLPEFGQQVIAWGTGPEQAKQRYESVNQTDIPILKQKGVTLAMAKEWQAFYENEVQRNPGNPAAFYRAKLMAKIVGMW
ncbi:hypothetical protein GWI33_010074 [Rhynchophorus ferrugineus]|uniref:DUF4951 domain-containing protein n=1 Tax=Rhynchophorus ferrugineus TaxID=354439 RepID=A0A834MAD3_RHYFE|nr:hypothetical protein GWI33_010074 [Rhynchophorus ferrugineus]